jgi:hypothetical protein
MRGLLVQPPVRQPEIVSNAAGLIGDDSVRHESRVNVTSDAGRVIRPRHGSAADYEDVRDDAPAGQAVAQGREGPFKLRPAEEDIVRLGHAAAKSLADR